MTTQPGKQGDLDGGAPDNHHTALLLIDVINDFEFPRGDELFSQALPIAPKIAELKRRARAAGIPAVAHASSLRRFGLLTSAGK